MKELIPYNPDSLQNLILSLIKQAQNLLYSMSVGTTSLTQAINGKLVIFDLDKGRFISDIEISVFVNSVLVYHTKQSKWNSPLLLANDILRYILS